MKSNMTIKVEFLVGTTINSAIAEAKLKAQEWNVAYVCFDFNGRSLSISQNTDLDKILEAWENTSLKYFVG